jgi:hypothetical protein
MNLVLDKACRVEVESKLWTGLTKGFVPEGRRDGSLAIYCQGFVQERNRPVGYGVIGSEGTVCHLER